MREDLPDLVAAFRHGGIRSKITTNGTLLTEEYVEQLLGAGLSSVIVSIHSADPEVHDRVVGMDGAWHRATQGVRLLKKAGGVAPDVCLHPLITGASVGPGLTGVVRLAAEIGADRVDFQTASCGHLSEGDRCRTRVTAAQVAAMRDEYVPQILEAAVRYGLDVSLECLAPEIGTDHGRGPLGGASLKLDARGDHAADYWRIHVCYSPFYYAFIAANGDVYACSRMRGRDGFLGSLREEALMRILNGDRALSLRRRLSAGECPDDCRTCTMHFEANAAIDSILRRTRSP